MTPSRYSSAETLCRSCLTSSKNMVHLDSPLEDVLGQLSSKAMLENLISQRVIINDFYPSTICHMCVSMLKLSHRFKQQVEEIQRRVYRECKPKPKPQKTRPKKKRIKKEKVVDRTPAGIPSQIRYIKLEDLIFIGQQPDSHIDLTQEKLTIINTDSQQNSESSNLQLMEIAQEETDETVASPISINNNMIEEEAVDNPVNDSDDENEHHEIKLIELDDNRENSTSEGHENGEIIGMDDDNRENENAELTEMDDDNRGNENAELTEMDDDNGENENAEAELTETDNHDEHVNNFTVKLDDYNEELSNLDFGEIKILEEDDHDYGEIAAKSDSQLEDNPIIEDEDLDEILVSCKICFELIPMSSMDSHMQLHVNPENRVASPNLEKDIVCRRCGHVYETLAALHLHLKNVHNFPKPKFVCLECDYVGHSDSSIRHHRWGHRGRQFKCSKCPKNYSTLCQLREHLKKHYNMRNYLCNVCGKGFNYSIGLKYHLRLHEEKSFVCPYCGLKYRMEYSLKRHIRTHTKEKPYHCQYCTKTFSSNGEMRSHELIHTGVKPYKCVYCPKRFTKSANRTVHYMSHPGPHACSFCQRSFMEAYLLNKHMKQRHLDIAEVAEIFM